MESERGTVAEYVAALKASGKFGPQLVAHRVMPAKEPETASCELLVPELRRLLAETGVRALYSHQRTAIEQVLAGIQTVVATPTASGKSLIYTLPVFQTLRYEPAAKALYLFPLKALAQDQPNPAAALCKRRP